MPSELLSGVRVVSIAQNVPGPLAVARLAGRGASATKVEPPSGDPFISLCPSWYEEMHRDVTVERLDLKSTDGRVRLIALLRDADLFITSHRPSALARLRIDPETLRAELPQLSIIRVVGSVEDPEEAGHDLTYQAHAGLARETMPLTLAADVMASERVYAAALELLRRPSGSLVDVGLVESLDALRAPLRHGLTAPGGTLGGGAPRYRIYAARDGHVALAALEVHFERRFYELVGLPIGSDPSAAFLERSVAEWVEWARKNDVPLAAIATVSS
jgi:crotonobetainyl-CoA:carnitine CoA-transferase CaiB-like acyl-CoA transferase